MSGLLILILLNIINKLINFFIKWAKAFLVTNYNFNLFLILLLCLFYLYHIITFFLK